MRVLRNALISAMLLGCGEASSPAQPSGQSASQGPAQGGSQGIDAAVAGDDDRPIRGFFATGFPTGGSEPIGTGFTEIQKLSLPPGKYIANGSAVVASDGAEVHFIDCVFLTNGSIHGDAARGMVGGNITQNLTSLPLTIGFTISGPTDLVLGCRSEVAGVVFSQTSHITAIRVERLTIQQP